MVPIKNELITFWSILQNQIFILKTSESSILPAFAIWIVPLGKQIIGENRLY